MNKKHDCYLYSMEGGGMGLEEETDFSEAF